MLCKVCHAPATWVSSTHDAFCSHACALAVGAIYDRPIFLGDTDTAQIIDIEFISKGGHSYVVAISYTPTNAQTWMYSHGDNVASMALKIPIYSPDVNPLDQDYENYMESEFMNRVAALVTRNVSPHFPLTFGEVTLAAITRIADFLGTQQETVMDTEIHGAIETFQIRIALQNEFVPLGMFMERLVPIDIDAPLIALNRYLQRPPPLNTHSLNYPGFETFVLTRHLSPLERQFWQGWHPQNARTKLCLMFELLAAGAALHKIAQLTHTDINWQNFAIGFRGIVSDPDPTKNDAVYYEFEDRQYAIPLAHIARPNNGGPNLAATLVMIDWGNATSLNPKERNQTYKDEIFTTFMYHAPEYYSPNKTLRSLESYDTWQLGLLMWSLITGICPHKWLMNWANKYNQKLVSLLFLPNTYSTDLGALRRKTRPIDAFLKFLFFGVLDMDTNEDSLFNKTIVKNFDTSVDRAGIYINIQKIMCKRVRKQARPSASTLPPNWEQHEYSPAILLASYMGSSVEMLNFLVRSFQMDPTHRPSPLFLLNDDVFKEFRVPTAKKRKSVVYRLI